MTSEKLHIEQRPSNGLKVVDLFCGAGVGACGIKLAGFDIVWGIDNNKFAVDTYNNNIGNHAVYGDVKKLQPEEIPEHDLMVSTPTCKSFSWAGTGLGFEHEEHGDLIFHFFRLLEAKKPKSFLFENVDGMLSKKNKPIFLKFVEDVESIGYKVTWKVINCYDYGIPQHRKRVFAVGIRNDINKEFVFPEEVKMREKTTIRDAIGDLPEPNMVLNSSKDIQFVNENPSNIPNHMGYGIRKDEKPFVEKINIGGNWRNLCKDDAKAFLGGAFNAGGGRTGFLRKVSFDKPSHTLTSTMLGKNNAQILDNRDKYNDINLKEDFDNLSVPPVNRRFTVRECLRLQTVPDWFSFNEDISLSKQYERCSGIPSLMAYKLVIEIEKALL